LNIWINYFLLRESLSSLPGALCSCYDDGFSKAQVSSSVVEIQMFQKIIIVLYSVSRAQFFNTSIYSVFKSVEHSQSQSSAECVNSMTRGACQYNRGFREVRD